MTTSPEKPEDAESIDLKDPALAAFLAWLIPGLGHWYQGRTAKACLFFVCIMSTFLYGIYLGGSSELGWGRVVYFSWRDEDKRLPYLCQVGIGLPALPALVQANRVSNGRAPLLGGLMATPPLVAGHHGLDGGRDAFGEPTLDMLHKKLHRYFELGTVYTMIAGLLNILAVYDAWGGPVFSEQARKDDEDEEGERDEDGNGTEQSDQVPVEASS